VAVFGGSNDPRKLGNFLLENLKRYGYPGDILPIHPRETEVAGLRAYASLAALPHMPDVALICLPAESVRPVVETCAEHGVRSAIVYTCGFGEGEKQDEAEEERLRSLARETGIRIMGPNCMGAYNVAGQFNATFFKDLPTEPGGVGFISQAGSVGGILFHRLSDLGVGLSKYFATGNMVDIDQTDLLLHLAKDPETRVIALYLETVLSPSRFMAEAARVVTRKPTVVFKSGTTAAGARAALSHTGNLAGENELLAAAFARLGILQTHDTEEFLDAIKVLSTCPDRIPPSRRLAIVTISGGASVVASDACESKGLELPEPTKETRDQLRQLLPSFGSSRNPIDMTAQIPPQNYVPTVAATMRDPGIDGCIAMNVNLDLPEFGDAFAKAAESGPPVIGFVLETPRILERFDKARIPNFPTPERAVSAYRSLVRFGELQAHAVSRQKQPAATGSEHPSLASHQGVLDEVTTKRVLAEYEVPVAREEVVSVASAAAMTDVAGRLGYPVAVKIVDPAIGHKTEAGGVVLGITNEESLGAAADTMQGRFGEGARLVIQKMAPAGLEWILGVKRAAGFPPAVLCGAGGILSELMQDVAIRLCPLDEQDAREMIAETRAGALLDGWRGSGPLDRDLLVKTLLRLSQMALDNPRLRELDINPFIVSAEGGVVVDALAVLDKQ
jgi:acyl-CoA synthetase (NDP forming)